MLGDQLPTSALASAEASMASIDVVVSNPVAVAPSGGIGMISCDASVVTRVLQRPDFHQLEEGRRAPGHEGHHFPDAGPLDLAWLAGALPGVGWALEAGDHLEERLVLALGVAGAGFGAVAEGAGAVRS